MSRGASKENMQLSMKSSIGSTSDLFRKNADSSHVARTSGEHNLGFPSSTSSKRRVSFRDGRTSGPGSPVIMSRNTSLSSGYIHETLTPLMEKRNKGKTSTESVTSDTGPALVEVAYYETLMVGSEPLDDPTYLPGFKEMYAKDQLWLSDVSCCPCRPNTKWIIQDKNGVNLFYIRKTQNTLMTIAKALFLFPFSSCRNGFTSQIRSLLGTRLVTFKRKRHYCATQLDIVEAFYGKEMDYIGRIERSHHGFLLRDAAHTDIYRVLDMPTSQEYIQSLKADVEFTEDVPGLSGCRTLQNELKVFRSDTKENVGRLVYAQRGFWLRFCTGCIHYPEVGIMCNSDIGTNAKILLVGTLLFMTHSRKDKFVNLPLGPDAVGYDEKKQNISVTSLESDTSLEYQYSGRKRN